MSSGGFSGLTFDQAQLAYRRLLLDADEAAVRELCLVDSFFLLVYVLGRKDACRPWIFEKCRIIDADPDGHLDAWAREHYKSTIITFAKTIQAVLIDPEITIGIFSHTRPIAKQFLSQIMREFEGNELLKGLFPDILFAEPARQSPRWSLDLGIIVRRKGNPKECTVEAWGLVDGQPTSKHFGLMVYDDVVTRESVSTSEMMAKTTAAWEMSLNLGSDGGRRRVVGTFYHQLDTYSIMIKRGIPARIFPATHNGKADGDPVLFSREAWEDRKKNMGSYTLSTQMLCNPVAEGSLGFRENWLCYWLKQPARSEMNVYILVDPASKKKRVSDYTSMVVIGCGTDGNYYWLDGVRDKLSLTERARELMRLVRKWNPIRVGYEEYGLQADIEHIRHVMEEVSFRFSIFPLGGPVSKEHRIERLQPVFEHGRFWMPVRMLFVDVQGKSRDLVREFIDEEYSMFPVSSHDDTFDSLARILDPEFSATFPKVSQDAPFALGRPSAVANGDYDVLAGSVPAFA